MCDETDLARWAKSGLSRREFSAIGVAAGIAACAPVDGAKAGAGGLAESKVSFATQDGTMDAFFVHPASGKSPAIILWPDIAGLREAKMAMARRLAGEGYAVLAVNPYYRDTPAPQFADFADFAAKGGFQMVGPWRAKLDPDAIARDAKAIVAWLDSQDAVDTAKGIGAQGYCMTGSFAIRTVAAAPERMKAAASFHGGGLVGEDATSPDKLLAPSAQYLIAIAQNDDAKAPTDKDALRKAADAASVKAEIEVYPADHGWCVLDAPSYNQPEADRAWGRLLALYGAAL
mgnify:FL=1